MFFLNKSAKGSLGFKDVIVFSLTCLTAYLTSYFQFPRMRGGDGFWLAQIAISLSDGTVNVGDFAGAGHEPSLDYFRNILFNDIKLFFNKLPTYKCSLLY